jgi:hypothetical protein
MCYAYKRLGEEKGDETGQEVGALAEVYRGAYCEILKLETPKDIRRAAAADHNRAQHGVRGGDFASFTALLRRQALENKDTIKGILALTGDQITACYAQAEWWGVASCQHVPETEKEVCYIVLSVPLACARPQAEQFPNVHPPSGEEHREQLSGAR